MKSRFDFKKGLRFLLREISFGGHILSIGAAFVVFTTTIIFELEVSFIMVFSVYLFVQSIFWFDRWFGIQGDIKGNVVRNAHVDVYVRYIPFFCIVYVAILTICLFSVKMYNSLIMALVLVLLGGFYGVFFKGFTKAILGFKDYFVAMFYVLFIIYTFIFSFKFSTAMVFFLQPKVLLFAAYIFIRNLLIPIFLDLKDIEDDANQGLKTFPVLFGKSSTLRIISWLNAISMSFIFFGVVLDILPRYMLLAIIPTVILWWYSLKKVETKSMVMYVSLVSLENMITSVCVLIGSILSS